MPSALFGTPALALPENPKTLMPVGTILLVILILILIGVLPTYGYSRDFGWAPSGMVGVLVVVLLILLITRQI
jgi:Protein of unknown function (DUF3309)